MTFNRIKIPLQQTLLSAKEQACKLNRNILAVVRISIERFDLMSLLENNKERSDISLWLGKNGHSMIGFGVAYELVAKGEKRFELISNIWEQLLSDAVIMGNKGPIAIGGFRFDTHRDNSELWNCFPDAALTIPVIMVYSESTGMEEIIISDFITSQSDIKDHFTKLEKFWDLINTKKEFIQSKPIKNFTIQEKMMARRDWLNLVNHALNSINQKKIEKVAVARTICLETDQPILPTHVIHKLYIDNPQACIFAFGRQDFYFVGATPEILFSVQSGIFQTMALAGTIRRGSDDEEDKILGENLLHSDKNQVEHAFVVNVIKKILMPICVDIDIDMFPSLYKLTCVQHLVTYFKGKIKENKNILDIISNLHPTPAVGGIPKEAAMTFLKTYENVDRGWYASPVGWIDSHGNGEFMVALRSGLLNGKNAFLFAGCGIVANSEPESEYQETTLKFATMMNAIIPKNNIQR